MIPLYLPDFQEWRKTYDEFIDYRKYKFNIDDLYAFGRIIDDFSKNLYFIEVFRYVGKIPDCPETIANSGRMFPPLIASGRFEKGRWRIVFEDTGYDRQRDSNYDNMSFLLGGVPPRIWKGGEEIRITKKQYDEAWKSGNPPSMSINGPVDVEIKIRKVLTELGIELNYEQIVEERRLEYPQPKDIDKKLKETIFPFRWISQGGIYIFTLDASALNNEIFTKHSMLGNGYDWERLAMSYMEEKMPECEKIIIFDCEADTFSAHSTSKKLFKKFALAFHQLCMDKIAFEKMLEQII